MTFFYSEKQKRGLNFKSQKNANFFLFIYKTKFCESQSSEFIVLKNIKTFSATIMCLRKC